MTFVFQALAKAATALGVSRDQSAKSLKWFRDQAKQLTSISANELMRSDPDRMLATGTINRSAIGKMLLYFYDPKTKDKLPYYDRFPCIFVVDLAYDKKSKQCNGFYGLNLHYLSPFQRARFMDELYKTNNSKRTLKYKLNINYGILKGASNLSAFRPCFKRYLYTHVRSKFLVVRTEEWDTIAMLPIARFERGGGKGGKVGAPVSMHKIYRDSRRSFR